jgi:predicted O-linked N-acetylglucosamine transferase (SPINDLY family)
MPAAVPRYDLDPDPERPLRIGLVSPDFCEHPVARFVLPFVEAADRDAIHYVAFAQQGWSDEVTERLRTEMAEWYEIQRLSDPDAARLVREQKIDILVDLAGHTANGRLGLFMQRPAPIQASYLGYPGTTGLTSIRYRMTDGWADPTGKTEPYHTEELIRLPQGFLCFAPPPDAPDVVDPPVLRNGFVTFGSFNNLAKLSARTIALWARVLTTVPGARLMLKSRPLGDAKTRARILKRFAEAGIPPDRLELRGRVDGHAAHLAAYGEVDIALDTVPYNGTTTSCEALYMGVPMVGLAGPSHVTRVGVSILSSCGLGKLVGKTEDDYVAIAAALAQSNDRLVQLREAIRPAMLESSLTDRVGFARRIEAVWRVLWRRHLKAEAEH